MGKGKVRDEVDRELFERERERGFNGRERQDHRMCVNFVLLANSATSNEIINKHGEAWPPEVAFYNSLCAELSKMTRMWSRMDRVKQGGPSGRWDICTFVLYI